MRVKRERKPVEVICVDCGCTFTAFSRGALRCAECKVEHKRRTAATGMASYRNGKKQKPYKVKKSIREVRWNWSDITRNTELTSHMVSSCRRWRLGKYDEATLQKL